MTRFARFTGLGILGIALVVGVGVSGDAKKDKEPGTGSTKSKGMPTGWKTLKLTAAQKKKVYAIHEQYEAKFKDLENQLAELKAKERAEMVRVLTADQKAKLLQGLTGETTKDKTPIRDTKK